jgi:hypothetical protein
MEMSVVNARRATQSHSSVLEEHHVPVRPMLVAGVKRAQGALLGVLEAGVKRRR